MQTRAIDAPLMPVQDVLLVGEADRLYVAGRCGVVSLEMSVPIVKLDLLPIFSVFLSRVCQACYVLQ